MQILATFGLRSLQVGVCSMPVTCGIPGGIFDPFQCPWPLTGEESRRAVFHSLGVPNPAMDSEVHLARSCTHSLGP